jgi:hypothetical protein
MKQAEAGTEVAEIIRKMGVSEQTFYRWKRRYAGMTSRNRGAARRFLLPHRALIALGATARARAGLRQGGDLLSFAQTGG